jgi:hypothetical protein
MSARPMLIQGILPKPGPRHARFSRAGVGRTVPGTAFPGPNSPQGPATADSSFISAGCPILRDFCEGWESKNSQTTIERAPVSRANSTVRSQLPFLLSIPPLLRKDRRPVRSFDFRNQFHGSTTSRPQSMKSPALRVASFARRAWAMAAICASAWLIGRPRARR